MILMEKLAAAIFMAVFLLGCTAPNAVQGSDCGEYQVLLPHSNENATICLSVNESGPYCNWKRLGRSESNERNITYFETGGCSSSGTSNLLQINYSSFSFDYSFIYDYSHHVGYNFDTYNYNCTRGNCGFPVIYNYSTTNYNYENENKTFGNVTMCFSNNTYSLMIGFDRDWNETTVQFGAGCPRAP
jgi:hypothetical protein